MYICNIFIRSFFLLNILCILLIIFSLSKKLKEKKFRINDIIFRKNKFIAINFEFRLIR